MCCSRSKNSLLGLAIGRLLAVSMAACGAVSAMSPGVAGDEELPRGARARLGSTNFRCEGEVTALVFLERGRLLAGGMDTTLRLWECPSGKSLAGLAGHTDWITSLSRTFGTAQVVSGSWDGTVRLWDADRRRELKSVRAPCDWISSVAAAGEGKAVAGCSDGVVRIIDFSSGSAQALGSHAERVHQVACSSDGTRAVSTSISGDVVLWDVTARKQERILRAPGSILNAIVLSPDGQFLAGADKDKGISLWNLKDNSSAKLAETHRGAVKSLALDQKGERLASGGTDGTIKLWDLRARSLLKTIDSGIGEVRTLALAPEGDGLAASGDGVVIRFWGPDFEQQGLPDGSHTGIVTSLAFSADGGRLASSSTDKRILIWDVASGKRLISIGTTSRINSLCFAGGTAPFIAAAGNGPVTLWDQGTGKALGSLGGNEGQVFCVASDSAGSRLASGGEDGKLRIWDTESRKLLLCVPAHDAWIYTLAFSRDGQSIASGARDGTVRIWRTEKGEKIAEVRNGLNAVFCLTYLESSRIAFGGQGSKITVWDWGKEPGTATCEGRGGAIRGLLDLGDGLLLSASEDRVLQVWRWSERKLVASAETGQRINAIGFSRSGRIIASGHTNGTSYVWTLDGILSQEKR